MKATGVVRRIDELGRIVIPKEIRRTLKIREGTPLEIYSGEDGELILKKYSPLVELNLLADEIASSIHQTLGHNVLVVNMEKVLASSGAKKNVYINKSIDVQLEKIIEERKTQLINVAEKNIMFFYETETKNFVVSPILEGGDVYGAIIIFADANLLGDTEKIIASSFADFFSKQIG